jgi:hypothetical protein
MPEVRTLTEIKNVNIYKQPSVADPAWRIQFSINTEPQMIMMHNEFSSPWIKRIYTVANWLAHKIAMRRAKKLIPRPFFIRSTRWYS